MLDHPHIIRLYQVRLEYYLCVVYLYFFLSVCGWVGTFVVKGRRLTWHVHSQMCSISSSLAAVFDSQRQLNMKLPEILLCSQFDWEASTKLWGERMTAILFSYSSWQLAWKKTQYVYTHRLLAGKTRLSVISAKFFKYPCHVLFLSISALFQAVQDLHGSEITRKNFSPFQRCMWCN